MINKYILLFRRGRAIRKAGSGDSSKEWVKDTNYSEYRNNGNGTRTYRFSTYKVPTEQKTDYNQSLYDVLKAAVDDTFIQKLHPEWYNEDGTLNTSYKVPTESNTSIVDLNTTDTSNVVETPTTETLSSTVQVPNTTNNPTKNNNYSNLGSNKSKIYGNLDKKAAVIAKLYGLDLNTYGTAEGIAKWQAANGFTGSNVDGDFGPNTIKAMIRNGLIKLYRPYKGHTDKDQPKIHYHYNSDGTKTLIKGNKDIYFTKKDYDIAVKKHHPIKGYWVDGKYIIKPHLETQIDEYYIDV